MANSATRRRGWAGAVAESNITLCVYFSTPTMRETFSP